MLTNLFGYVCLKFSYVQTQDGCLANLIIYANTIVEMTKKKKVSKFQISIPLLPKHSIFMFPGLAWP